MGLRGIALVGLPLLAGCSASGGESGGAAGATPAKIPCALAGAKSFTGECVVERASANGRTVVTLRHPDGGFRRLVEIDGGKAYAAADGSDQATLARNGAEIEVTVGNDHYLFPAPARDDTK